MRLSHSICLIALVSACVEAKKATPPEPKPASPVPTAKTRTSTASSTASPVLYELSFPEPHTHYIEVQATFPARDRSALELFLPVWTPGSYLVREYMRNVEALVATDASGAALPLERTRKNRVRVRTMGHDRIQLSYKVYANEMTVRTSFVDVDGAFITGTTVFFADPEAMQSEHIVSITKPVEWHNIATTLRAHEEDPETFLAKDYDELVDSPFLVGTATTVTFELDGIEHSIVSHGDTAKWDHARAATDVQRLVERHRELWGSLPYPRYYFFNLLTESSGGLEHRDSSVLMASGLSMQSEEKYRDWLSLASHEIFHAWNVKRLRPVELGPFDYENEVYTKSLWIAEGVTSYYDDLLARRAGLFDRKEYLQRLAKTIDRFRGTPGRRVQDLQSSSYDAWIKYYRPDENALNARISYYVKGALVAFVLDAKIREATRDTKSLDDVMRRAFALYSGERGYTEAEFQDVVAEVAGKGVRTWLAKTLVSTDELDVETGLDYFGLRFAESKDKKAKRKPWIGIGTRADGERLFVTEVVRDSPAWRAGVSAEDEVLAIGDLRATSSRWTDLLETLSPAEATSLTLSRRGRVRDLPLVLGERPVSGRELETLPWTNATHGRRLDGWLGPERTGDASRDETR